MRDSRHLLGSCLQWAASAGDPWICSKYKQNKYSILGVLAVPEFSSYLELRCRVPSHELSCLIWMRAFGYKYQIPNTKIRLYDYTLDEITTYHTQYTWIPVPDPPKSTIPTGPYLITSYPHIPLRFHTVHLTFPKSPHFIYSTPLSLTFSLLSPLLDLPGWLSDPQSSITSTDGNVYIQEGGRRAPLSSFAWRTS